MNIIHFKRTTSLNSLVLFGSIITLSLSSLVNATTDVWIENSNGTVTDLSTGLIWQQQDDAIGRTHADAIAYCQSLNLAGHSDWRLPNVKELGSISDFRKHTRAIDAEAFPNTGSSYWSETNAAFDISRAWMIFTQEGFTNHSTKTSNLLARCVR